MMANRLVEKIKGKLPHLEMKHFFLLPSIAILAALLVFPILYAFFNMSLFDFSGEEKVFVGLSNFISVVNDPSFINALIKSVYFTALSVGTTFGLGLGLALLLRGKFMGKSFYQSVYLIPMAMAPAIIAYGFKFMLDPSLGVINDIIASLGFSKISFTGSSTMALHTLIMIDIWQWTPFAVLVLTAALESLPKEPFEAADVMGASKWQTFKSITFPMIKPAALVVLLIRLMDSLKVVDKIMVLTGGGPGKASETLAVFGWRTSFSFFRFGKGTAIGLILLFIIIVICWTFVKIATGGGDQWKVV